MDKATLVDIDFRTGDEVLEILDASGVQISVAMWVCFPEYGDWRFLLASRQLDRAEPSKAYGLIHQPLRKAGIPLERTPTLMILKMTDPFIRALRHVFGKTKSTEGMRLGGQMIGDRFIDDALVFRIQ